MTWIQRLIKLLIRDRKRPASPEDDPILPTGQRRSEILAMRDRAEKETNEEREARLGVVKHREGNKIPKPRFTVSIQAVETPRPEKDATLKFSILGQPCKVRYYSDWKYLSLVTDPEEYHADPRRWVDIYFGGEMHGYAWPEALWTHAAEGLKEKDQIEYMICQHFGTLCAAIAPGDISTTRRQSLNGKYVFWGRAGGLCIEAEFRHKGYIIQLELGSRDKGRYDSRTGKLSVPVRFQPAASAISDWLAQEYSMLRPLNGELPENTRRGPVDIQYEN